MIDLYVFNRDLELVGEISDYESLEMELNYNNHSKMVLRAPKDKRNIDLLKEGNILTTTEKLNEGYYIDHFSTVFEKNVSVIEVFAYSLTYYLSWRVIPKQQRYTGTVEEVIRNFVNYNCINTTTNRVIPRLTLGAAKGFTEMTESTSTGANVAEHCYEIAQESGKSLEVTINQSNKTLEFSVWEGVNRSSSQVANGAVMFSTDFDNVVSYEYFKSNLDYKNVCYVAGEGEGVSRKVVESGNASGLDRREMYIDVRDLQSKYQNENGTEVTLTPQQYLDLLEKRGFEELSINKTIESFESTIDDVQYIVGRDYWLGDIVTFYDSELNVTIDVRVNSINVVSNNKGVVYKPSFGTGIPNKLIGGK